MVDRLKSWSGTIDPVVSSMLVATSGSSYAKLRGNPELDTYPIPPLRLPPGEGRLLLDVGCNWGRWCISAARKGYRPVGIDMSLGGVMAARRTARDLGVDVKFVVGDVRYLPFREGSFPTVFSHSVLQHLSREHVREVLSEIRRVLQPGGKSLIQMAHWPGIRSQYQLARRGFRDGQGFEVRYWRTSELREAFESLIGESTVSVHCYFGLGLEPGDVALLPMQMRAVIGTSEFLRRLSDRFPLLRRVADSVYVESTKVRTS